MTLYVSEYLGLINRYRSGGITPSPVTSYSLSSASTYPFPSAGVSFIRVTADAGMLLALNGTSTGVTLTSTNAVRIPANAPAEMFAVSTAFRVIAQSS